MKNERGFGLIEALLMILAISFVVILIAGVPNALSLVGQSRYLSVAREIANKTIEDARISGYDNLVNSTENIIDTRINTLPSGSGTIEIDDCDISICTNNEHLKELTVIINWKEKNKDQQIVITTMVSDNNL